MKQELKSVADYYRDLRLSSLTSPKYKHLLLALFWPVFGLIFMMLEHAWPLLWEAMTGRPLIYREVVSALDAYIPFCEWFVIPYYFWFAFLAVMGVWSLLFDLHTFRRFSWFVILSYSITAIIYVIWPNMQSLRPVELPRDNLMSDVVRWIYDFDTNTNVCPSIHVLGSFAVCFAGLHSSRLCGWGWKCFFIISTLLITMSTVFLKQHSIIDVFAAFAVCAVC